MMWLRVLTLLLSVISSSAVAELLVTVFSEGKRINFDHATRLSQVLTTIQPSAKTYWLAATFGEPKNPLLVQQQDELVARLTQLANQYNEQDPKRGAARRLTSWLASLSLVDKSFYSVDLDRVRLSLKSDPLLRGEFTFYFPPRPTQVQLISASGDVARLPHRAGQSIRDYIKQAGMSTLAGKVYIIQPDGLVERANIGYWLKPSSKLAPGATIFLSIDSLPKAYGALNEQIAELLRYQAYWWK